MRSKIFSVRMVVATGIGAALFFVLMRFVAVPSGIPNTTLNLAYAILALFAGIFGPLAGLLIGLIGHVLTDLTWGYGIWWSWVIASAVFGLIVGLFFKLYRIEDGEFGTKQLIIFNVVQIAANLIAWVGIAPTLDILMYKEPAEKVYLQGLVAGGLNTAVVLIVGSLLAIGYSKTRTKAGSLSVDQ